MYRIIHSALLAAGIDIAGRGLQSCLRTGSAAADSPPTNSAPQPLSSGRQFFQVACRTHDGLLERMSGSITTATSGLPIAAAPTAVRTASSTP